MSDIRLPDGQVVTVEQSSPDFRFRAWLPPGDPGPPPHRHRARSESFTVIDGLLRVRVGPWHRDLLPGETLTVPPGVTHGLSNPHDEPACIACVESPAGPLQEQFRAMAASPGGRLPVLRLAEIQAEYAHDLTLAGFPDAPQRVLNRALAALARLRRAHAQGRRPH